MAAFKHLFTSAKSDPPAVTLVRLSDRNADHVTTGKRELPDTARTRDINVALETLRLITTSPSQDTRTLQQRIYATAKGRSTSRV